MQCQSDFRLNMESEKFNFDLPKNNLKTVKSLFSEFVRVINDTNSLEDSNVSSREKLIDSDSINFGADCSRIGSDYWKTPQSWNTKKLYEPNPPINFGAASNGSVRGWDTNELYEPNPPINFGAASNGSVRGWDTNELNKPNPPINFEAASNGSDHGWYANELYKPNPSIHFGATYKGSDHGCDKNELYEPNPIHWAASNGSDSAYMQVQYGSAMKISARDPTIAFENASGKKSSYSNMTNTLTPISTQVMHVELQTDYSLNEKRLEGILNKNASSMDTANYLYYLYDDDYAHDTIDHSLYSPAEKVFHGIAEVTGQTIQRSHAIYVEPEITSIDNGYVSLDYILNSPVEKVSDVGIAKVTGQMIQQSRASYVELEFASTSKSHNAIKPKHRSPSANQIVQPSIKSHQNCNDNNSLDYNLDSSQIETKVEFKECATFDIKRHQGCDDSNMFVPTSDAGVKKHCCIYCLKRYPKLERHLRTVHKNEAEVKKFLAYRPRTKERQYIIARIRKRGQFEWNRNSKINGGELSTSRRQKKNIQKKAHQHKTCAYCMGSYILLRQHWNRCTNNPIKGERFVTELARVVEGRLHIDASDDLNEVFASVRDDASIRMAKFDWLVVAYGNDLCLNYSPFYQISYIRAKLRAAAKLLQTVKSISSNIDDLSSLYHVTNCNTVIEAIRIMGKFSMQSKLFETPGTASTTVTLINTVGELLVTEAMKKDDEGKERNVERFLKLFKKEAKTKILKLVTISKAKARRGKKANIPTLADVNKFATFLETERNKCFVKLSQKYSYKEWVGLSQLTLVSILLFNRRRAGEMQNTLIEDFDNRKLISDQCDTILNSIPEEAKINVKSLMKIRGKLGRTVPAMIMYKIEDCLELLIHHRKDAGIVDGNKFLFALPTQTGRIKTINVWTAMRSFAVACGAENPSSLRGTNLRKHLASFCATKNLSDNDVTNVAEHMGHSEKVHRDVYRSNPLGSHLSQMFSLLKAAQGNNINDTDDSGTMHATITEDMSESDSSSKFSSEEEEEEVTTKTSKPRKTIRSSKRARISNSKPLKKKTVKKVVKRSSIKRKNNEVPKMIKKRKRID